MEYGYVCGGYGKTQEVTSSVYASIKETAGVFFNVTQAVFYSAFFFDQASLLRSIFLRTVPQVPVMRNDFV